MVSFGGLFVGGGDFFCMPPPSAKRARREQIKGEVCRSKVKSLWSTLVMTWASLVIVCWLALRKVKCRGETYWIYWTVFDAVCDVRMWCKTETRWRNNSRKDLEHSHLISLDYAVVEKTDRIQSVWEQSCPKIVHNVKVNHFRYYTSRYGETIAPRSNQAR